jgi:hypothetical protein
MPAPQQAAGVARWSVPREQLDLTAVLVPVTTTLQGAAMPRASSAHLAAAAGVAHAPVSQV